MKIIKTSNLIDIWTGLKFLLGLKLNGHIDTLTKASNFIDDILEKGEKQNDQHYRNAHE